MSTNAFLKNERLNIRIGGECEATTFTNVSVIIVSYNSANYIRECLNSIFRLTRQPVEIIVFDNASSDDTQDIIREEYPEVKLIESATNLGFAAANNRAARLASGKYLAFLNPDTVVERDWLEPLLKALESRSDIGAVTPMLVLGSDPDRINACGNDIHFSGLTYCRDFGAPRYEGEPFEVAAVSGAAFMLRKDLFWALGGFEEHFFLYYEDTDLCLRLRLIGFCCVLVPNSKVRHDYHGVFNAQKIYYLERNRLLSIFSLMKCTTLLLMLPSLALVEILSWGYCILHGKKALMAKIAAWCAVLQNSQWLVRRRRQLSIATSNNDSLLILMTHKLKIEYVDTRSKMFLSILNLAGWLAGLPFGVWKTCKGMRKEGLLE